VYINPHIFEIGTRDDLPRAMDLQLPKQETTRQLQRIAQNQTGLGTVEALGN
jgi:hypothetical protein